MATAKDVTQYAGKTPTDYHKWFATWIVKEVGYNPADAVSLKEAFLMGVSIATASRPAFLESEFLERMRVKNGVNKRGPKPAAEEVEEKPVRRTAKAAPAKKAAAPARKRAPEPDPEPDPEEEEDNGWGADEADDDISDFDDADEFGDDDDAAEEDDSDFDDDDFAEEPAPVAPKRGRPAAVKAAPAKKTAPAKKAAPAKAAARRAAPVADDDDDFMF